MNKSKSGMVTVIAVAIYFLVLAFMHSASNEHREMKHDIYREAYINYQTRIICQQDSILKFLDYDPAEFIGIEKKIGGHCEY